MGIALKYVKSEDPLGKAVRGTYLPDNPHQDWVFVGDRVRRLGMPGTVSGRRGCLIIKWDSCIEDPLTFGRLASTMVVVTEESYE